MKLLRLKTSLVITMGVFIACSAFAGWKFGQGVIDNIRGKDSAEAEYVDKKVQDAIDDIRKPVEKADEKISTAWNEWREEKVDQIGDYIAAAYKYLKAGHKGNPDGFPPQEKNSISNPDVQTTLNKNLLSNLLAQFVSEQIPLDKDNPNNGDYFYFDDANLSTDTARRVLILKISRGRLKFKFVTRNTLKINGATMEFLPKIRKTDDKLFLDLHARIVHLDIDDVLPMVERGIAHGLNDHMKNKDGANGFMSIDLSEKFTQSIKIPTTDQDTIEVLLSKATIFVEGDRVIYQSKLSASKK